MTMLKMRHSRRLKAEDIGEFYCRVVDQKTWKPKITQRRKMGGGDKLNTCMEKNRKNLI